MKFVYIVMIIFASFLAGYYYHKSTVHTGFEYLPADTVYIEKAVPKYITKTKYIEGKTDTVYSAVLDTTVNDFKLNISYDSSLPIPLGHYNVNVTPKPAPVFSPKRYYASFSLNTSLINDYQYTISAGSYLLNTKDIKIGIGAYYQRLQNITDYGLNLKVNYEF